LLLLFFLFLFILVLGQLLALPSQLGKLVRLQVLSVRNNALIALPSETTKLKALQELDLYSNKIAKLPSSLGKYVHHGLASILLPPLTISVAIADRRAPSCVTLNRSQAYELDAVDSAAKQALLSAQLDRRTHRSSAAVHFQQ
jgi:Leucine-rich repeat (LRR) protein